MTETQTSNLQSIPMAKIRIREDKLRDVNRNDKFEDTRESIKVNGLLQPILVMPDPHQDGGYVLIDGLHRYTACSDLGMLMIDAKIIESCDEDETNVLQIIANENRQSTSKMAIAKAIQRMMANPKYSHFTKKQWMDKFGYRDKSPQWFDNQLCLTNLVPEAEEAVERGEINLSNASQLGKLDAEEQLLNLEAAQNEPADSFAQRIQNRLQEIKAELKGQDAKDLDPLRLAKMRSKTELKDKYNELQPLVLKDNCDPATMGFFEGVAWCIRMDSETLEERDRKEKEQEQLKKQQLEERQNLIAKQKEIARKRREAAEANG